jgi:hypothetical protein
VPGVEDPGSPCDRAISAISFGSTLVIQGLGLRRRIAVELIYVDALLLAPSKPIDRVATYLGGNSSFRRT